VGTNQQLWTGLFLAGLLSLGLLGYVGVRGIAGTRAVAVEPVTLRGATVAVSDIRFDLAANRAVKWFLRRRAFQFALVIPTLWILALVIAAGFFGSPVGDHNLAIVLVWTLWWPLWLLVALPLGGRSWCAVCPVPVPGEWVQRLGFIRRREGKPLSMGRPWPRRLRNMWPQTLSFLAVASVGPLVLTSPIATGYALAAFVGLAVLLALVFRGRRFCLHACPLGGFIGLYSLMTPFVLGARDKNICQVHSEKSCLEGNACGYGCPWFVYPAATAQSSNCGLCMECVKTCSKDNIALGFQAPGQGLVHNIGRPDEAFRAIVLLSVALVYAIVMFGPWGWLKVSAGNPATIDYLAYIGLLVVASLLVVPLLVLGAAHTLKLLFGGGTQPTARIWIHLSYSLVPLGLLAWVAFAVAVFSTGVTHIPAIISDPLGRGWDLFGTADVTWDPLYPRLLPYLQAGGLLVGLAWSLTVLRRRASGLVSDNRQRTLWGLIPMVLVLFGITSVFMWLFLR